MFRLFDKAILEVNGKQVIIVMFAIDDEQSYKYATNKWITYLEEKAKGFDRVILGILLYVYIFLYRLRINV